MKFCFFQAEDGIRDLGRSRGPGEVYNRHSIFLFEQKPAYEIIRGHMSSEMCMCDGPLHLRVVVVGGEAC